MSVVDRVRGVITPATTPVEQAAAEAKELKGHIERTRTERARRLATATDLQRQLNELAPRLDLLRARRDRGLASKLDDVEQIEQDLADLETRQVELTVELAEARAGVDRADLAITDFQQRQQAALATVVDEKRRENLAAMIESCAEFEEWANGGAAIWQRIYVQAQREEALAGEAEPPRADYTVRPSRVPALGYLGSDPNQLVESVRTFRKMLGQV